jgi:hypothetical protein
VCHSAVESTTAVPAGCIRQIPLLTPAGCVDMLTAMTHSVNHHDCGANAGEQGSVGGFLRAALNMEDQISEAMYEEYMSRSNWPADLGDKTFEQIRKRLTTLVEDTKKHTKILQALVKEHAKSK